MAVQAAVARAEQWVIAALNSVEPIVMAVAINDIFEADMPWSKERHPKVIADLRARLAELSTALGDKTWLDGNSFTVGDLVMIHVLRGALGGPLEEFSNLSEYVARGEARPAYQRALAAHLADFVDVAQIQQGSLHHIKMTLIQMSIFGHGNETMDPVPELIALFKGFEAILKRVLPRSLGFNRLVIRSPEVLLSTNSGDFLIDAASGGVIKLFEVAWQLYFFSKTVSEFVITFDEPENHLHPSMQKSFLPSIMDAFPDCQIIVVTHSPFIISAMRDSSVYVLQYADTELLGNDIDDDKSVLGMMGSRVVAVRLDTVNKAGTASEILRDVLGITTTIRDWAEDRVSVLVEEYRGRPIDEIAMKQLYSQMEKEGLISSYPVALSSLTRPR